MKTRVPSSMVDPKLITGITRSSSNLHFTFGDGTSSDVDLLAVGNAVLTQATANANSQINTATLDFVRINPPTPVEGAVKAPGLSGFIYNATWLQITA